MKNAQDAIIYKKSVPNKSSQATLSRILKSTVSNGSDANSSIKEKISFYDSQTKAFNSEHNELTSISDKNSISNKKRYSITPSSLNHHTSYLLAAAQSGYSIESEQARIKILQKSNNKPFYFSIDNHRNCNF